MICRRVRRAEEHPEKINPPTYKPNPDQIKEKKKPTSGENAGEPGPVFGGGETATEGATDLELSDAHEAEGLRARNAISSSEHKSPSTASKVWGGRGRHDKTKPWTSIPQSLYTLFLFAQNFLYFPPNSDALSPTGLVLSPTSSTASPPSSLTPKLSVPTSMTSTSLKPSHRGRWLRS
ncbi:hypothetical protein TIFTF001_009933 [Ficus carica]|uniref:Uncharacterized protein n=1 Tax=Ficus carica TaxID=3494 RepID=A0AA88AI14_FICCA|nr:hypothetical protein TIFTF001_009933 [Ficus carica]